VEPGERLEDAVVREVAEEVGARVTHVSYVTSQPWPFPSSLMIAFDAVAEDRTLRVNTGEMEDARWFTRAEIDEGLAARTLELSPVDSVSRLLVERWRNSD
jgi:NAD+ diphosphatase